MSTWYLITHNLSLSQEIAYRIRALGADVFSPMKMTVTKRSDCNGTRNRECQLFPGYLFVKLDPEIVHTSAVLQIMGVIDFVRFGGVLATISDALIDAIKISFLIRTDKKASEFEYRNVHPEILASLEAITIIKSKLERQVAFFNLLQKEKHILSSGYSTSRLVSVIDRPFVNDLIP
ncbi:MAG: transcriptional regulator [Proteobacteria bacterium]|nr:MAG: transcriptional regulator [Pseudomonadota bacterium]